MVCFSIVIIWYLKNPSNIYISASIITWTAPLLNCNTWSQHPLVPFQSVQYRSNLRLLHDHFDCSHSSETCVILNWIKCPVCGHGFNQNGNLRRHQQKLNHFDTKNVRNAIRVKIVSSIESSTSWSKRNGSYFHKI